MHFCVALYLYFIFVMFCFNFQICLMSASWRLSEDSLPFALIFAPHLIFNISSFSYQYSQVCIYINISSLLLSFQGFKTQSRWNVQTNTRMKQIPDAHHIRKFLFPITLSEQSLWCKCSFSIKGIAFGLGPKEQSAVQIWISCYSLLSISAGFFFFFYSPWPAIWPIHTNMILTNLFLPHLVLEIDPCMYNSWLQTGLWKRDIRVAGSY